MRESVSNNDPIIIAANPTDWKRMCLFESWQHATEQKPDLTATRWLTLKELKNLPFSDIER